MVEGLGLKGNGGNLVCLPIVHLLQPPGEGFGVHDNPEKGRIGSDREDMIESPAVPEGVVEADFFDSVLSSLVENLFRNRCPAFVVKNGNDGNRDVKFLDHKQNIPPYNPNKSRRSRGEMIEYGGDGKNEECRGDTEIR